MYTFLMEVYDHEKVRILFFIVFLSYCYHAHHIQHMTYFRAELKLPVGFQNVELKLQGWRLLRSPMLFHV